MKFYIVTPTFNALSWLQRCVRSVADQVGAGVEVHHHVQDGASDDGTSAWLQEWQQQHENVIGYTFTYESRKDAGMYDAINIAWAKMPADADVTAHLNSDEQYLPSALKGVADAFESNQKADIVLGTYIVVDADSRYICHRRPVKPARWRSQTVCEIITCSCFHRVETFLRHGIRFDTRYRALADLVFYREIVGSNIRFCLKPDLITSCFAVTGGNLAWGEAAQREWDVEMKSLPRHVVLRHGFAYRYANLLRRIVNEISTQPRCYAVYMPNQPVRSRFPIKNPTAVWGRRTVSDE